MGGFRFTGPNYVFVGIPRQMCKCSGYQQPIDSSLENWMLHHNRFDLSDLPEEMRSDFIKFSHMSDTSIEYKGYRKVMREPTRFERSFMDAENQVADLEPIELPKSTTHRYTVRAEAEAETKPDVSKNCDERCGCHIQ